MSISRRVDSLIPFSGRRAAGVSGGAVIAEGDEVSSQTAAKLSSDYFQTLTYVHKRAMENLL